MAFAFFRKRNDPEMDNLIASLQMNMANNYKDAAQEDYKKLRKMYEEKTEDGIFSARLQAKYDAMMADFGIQLRSYTHADQKPYWTKED